MSDQVLSWWNEYPYFWLQVLWLGLYVFLNNFMGKWKHVSLIAGILYLLLLPAQLVFEGDYWSPRRIGGGALGIEDVMSMFALGSISTASAVIPLRSRLSLPLASHVERAKRFFWVGLLGVLPFCLMVLGGFSAIASCAVAMVLVTAIILIVRPGLWPVALTGAIVFTFLYVIMISMGFWLWPWFETVWIGTHWWGRRIWGIPLGEVTYAVLLGAQYPTCVLFCLEAGLFQAPQEVRRFLS